MNKFNNSVGETKSQGVASPSANNKIMKRKFSPPTIQEIRLDNQISLQLASEPPTFESLNTGKIPEYLMQNPFLNFEEFG